MGSLSVGFGVHAGRVSCRVTGTGKGGALRRAQAGEGPAGMIPGAEWIVDRAAAAS